MASALADDPRPAEALALMSYALGQTDDGELHFREAYQRGSRSYLGHYLAGQRALQAAAQFSFGPPDVTEAGEALLRCLRINARFVPACESLAGLLTLLPVRSIEAETIVRIAGVRHPENLPILAGLALLEATHGEVAGARLAIQRARAIAGPRDPAGQRALNAAELLLANRERKAKATPPASVPGPALGR